MCRIMWLAVFSAISLSTVSCCGFPGNPAHAKLITTDDSFMEGTVVTFECDPGYQLLGRSMLRCVNSEWDSPGLPFCVREIAFSKPSGMSSRFHTASLAVDDKVSTCAVTEPRETHEWWVDLIETSRVHVVEVHYGNELDNLTINIAVEDPRSNATTACFHHENFSSSVTASQYFKCNLTTSGRKLWINISADHEFVLKLCEVRVYSQSVLSPQDACGTGTRGKIESFKGQCYEVTPAEASFSGADEFCALQGGSLWAGVESEFVSWMMSVHNLDSVWYRHPQSAAKLNATNCTAFTRDDEAAENRQRMTPCNESRFGICVRPPRSCGTPQLPKHLSDWKSIGDVRTGEVLGGFSCEDGFHLSGPMTYQCTSKGEFRRQIPTTCRQSPCGQPPRVANAFPVLAPKARYYCVNDSFVLYGSPELRCDPVDRKWATPLALCVRLSANTKFGVGSFRERLLQGVYLYPVATKMGLALFIITMVILKVLAVIAVTNLVRYFRVVKPKLMGKQSSSVMLSSMHDELSRDACQMPGEQDPNKLTVDANQELDLSTGDAQVVIRTTGSSTPKAPQTPKLRLNESSITESNTH